MFSVLFSPRRLSVIFLIAFVHYWLAYAVEPDATIVPMKPMEGWDKTLSDRIVEAIAATLSFPLGLMAFRLDPDVKSLRTSYILLVSNSLLWGDRRLRGGGAFFPEAEKTDTKVAR